MRAVFGVLGFAVEIATNSSDVLRAAEESWGPARHDALDAPVQLRIAVDDSGPQHCPPDPIFRGRRHLLTFIADPANFLVCDSRASFAFAWLTPGCVKNRAYFRYHFLESTALILVQSRYLVPIHAACAIWNGSGVLFCGDSGAGKSSLAFACALRGWTFVSDDATSLIRNGSDRVVIGNPHQVRFRKDAAQLFSELKHFPVRSRLNGELAIEIATDDLPSITTAAQAPVDYVIFLDRRASGPARFHSHSRKTAKRWFEQVICYGTEDFRKAQRDALNRLLSAEVLRFRYSDLPSAVHALESMIGAARSSTIGLSTTCAQACHA